MVVLRLGWVRWGFGLDGGAVVLVVVIWRWCLDGVK